MIPIVDSIESILDHSVNNAIPKISSFYVVYCSESVTLGSECLLIEGVVKKMQSAGQVLPHYNCLMLSPADLWSRNLHTFVQDPHILLTVKSLMVSLPYAKASKGCVRDYRTNEIQGVCATLPWGRVTVVNKGTWSREANRQRDKGNVLWSLSVT